MSIQFGNTNVLTLKVTLQDFLFLNYHPYWMEYRQTETESKLYYLDFNDIVIKKA